MKRFVLSSLLFLFVTAMAFAQTGAISGKVVDETTGEELFGATVLIKGTTKGGSTDFSGDFELNNIAPGKYTLVFSYVSYVTKEVTDVVVTNGKITSLNVSLSEKVSEATEVVIVASYKKESVNALLLQQKNATSIGDGVSAEVIRQSTASNSGDVIKKVSGASIQGGKFAVIRGLNDRYNTAYINGAPLPSTEPDRRAFSFDIIPAGMLDNMIISKTATPDMPGDFSGGIIQINTKDFPEINFYNLSVGTGYNAITTFKDFASYKGGKYDFLGIDDGTRMLPKGLSTNPAANNNIITNAENTNKFNNNYGSTFNAALPNTSLQYSMGMVKRYREDNSRSLSAVVGITYSLSQKFAEAERQLRLPLATDNQLLDSMHDNMYTTEVLWGAIANVSFKKNNNNRFSLKNLYNVSTEDQTVQRSRIDIQNQRDLKLESYYYIQNNIFSSQLAGDHYLPGSKLKIDWVAGINNIKRLVPDYRIMQYQKNIGADDSTYIAAIGLTPTVDVGGRFFSELDENLYSGRLDVLRTVIDNSKARIFKKMDIKVGGSLQIRERDFAARFVGWVTNLSFSAPQVRLPLDQIFAPQNTQSRANGFLLADQTNSSDKYTASSNLRAAYIMFDNKLGRRFRLIWGGRYEAFNQKLDALKNNAPVNINNDFNFFLPSGNLVYEINSSSNVRASVSRTVSRPEFRELAPFSFFDFNTFTTLVGNDSLKSATIMNYDLRYEIYPRAGGELISVSAFYKDFTNPIEGIILASGAGSFNSSYQNVPKAKNYGAELEVRKKLSFISKRSGLLNNSTFFGNFAYILSEVDLSKVASATTKKRPLQGQSNYIVNAGISLKDTAHDLTFAASVNRVGKRIAIAGTGAGGLFPDVWENPRTIIDLQITKTWGNFSAKLSVSDLLAQPLIFYMDRHQVVEENNKTANPDLTGTNNEGKFDGRTQDVLISRTTFGQTVSIGLSYKF